MNEVFKQLSLMAGGSHYPSINPDIQQRFGELIVEECIKQLLEWKNEPLAVARQRLEEPLPLNRFGTS